MFGKRKLDREEGEETSLISDISFYPKALNAVNLTLYQEEEGNKVTFV